MEIQSLSQIATEMEGFLSQWVTRFEALLDVYGDAPMDDAALQNRIAEFEEAKRAWNEERRQEVQQIQETTEQLTAAWERLEDQQRRVLQAQDSLSARAMERAPAELTPPDAAGGRSSHTTAADPPSGAETPPVHNTRQSSPPETGDAAPVSRDVAVRQFQTLRRQIGAHSS